jgi:hypothetical protein
MILTDIVIKAKKELKGKPIGSKCAYRDKDGYQVIVEKTKV